MSNFLRALLISAAATGVAAVVLKTLQPSEPAPPPRMPARPAADPDALTPDEEQMLLDELGAQL